MLKERLTNVQKWCCESVLWDSEIYTMGIKRTQNALNELSKKQPGGKENGNKKYEDKSKGRLDMGDSR